MAGQFAEAEESLTFNGNKKAGISRLFYCFGKTLFGSLVADVGFVSFSFDRCCK